MLLVFLVTFLASFALIVLVAVSVSGPRTSKAARANLDRALHAGHETRGANVADEEVADVRKKELLSSIPWLHDLLARINTALELRKWLDQADLNCTPARLMLTAVACWIGSSYLINLKTRLGFAALLAGAVVGCLPFLYVARRRRRRFNQFQKRLPETLDLMVSALRAGHSMSGALGSAAAEAPEPIGRELRLCFEEQNFGVDLRSAMENLVTRVPLQDLRIITTAMLINKESGGNLAEVLEKTSHVIRERFRLQQQILVHTAQGRLTGIVLTILPVVIGCLLYLVNASYMRVLFTEPLGHKLIAGACVMNLIGSFFIHKIVSIKV